MPPGVNCIKMPKNSGLTNLVNVGTEFRSSDTRERYRQKLARITLDSLGQFVGLLDAEGTVLEINRVALDAVGMQLSDVEGRPFWTTFWWQVSEEIRSTLRESILRASQGEFVRWDTQIYSSGDKKTITIDVSLRPVQDEQGNVVFIAAEGRDITEKKAQEREIARQREELARFNNLQTQFFANTSQPAAKLRAQAESDAERLERNRAQEISERLSAIVSSSDDAIVSKDLSGIVMSWNSAAERMFGYSAEEMIGKPITTIIPPELHDDETRILQTIAAGKRIEHFETVRLTKSGERIDVSLTVSPVKDAMGGIVGAAKIARDITQRKKAERALHTAERLASVGRLAATVAHEINNPLEALTNLIYLARNSGVRSEIDHYLAGAEEELDRISHLTKQTLGFYRETQGESAVRIGYLLNSLLPVFASKARNKGVRISSEIKDDPEICAIPGEIRQLIANLIGNSIEAVGKGGRIRVRVSAAPDWKRTSREGVRFTVADDGGGIPKALRLQLFEPFFTTKKDVGTGLGLWVCKSIVEKHQGSIRIKSSTVPGKSWTVFAVFLPLIAKQAMADNISEQAA